jgi:acyl-coenzyme A synthetase/AMP-(fatty) acid ligase/acyl carrier protein
MTTDARTTTSPRPLWRTEALAAHGTDAALVTRDELVTYSELARRVDDVARAWPGPRRRLVLVEVTPTVDAVVTYLAALQAGHVVVLSEPGRAADIARVWTPDDHAQPTPAGWRLEHSPDEGRHVLHPDLALLMSTSGSTGSPKLVRLSAESVTTNAHDIAAALGLRATDRGVTALPLHYCYGLSVLHSHLAVGASVVLTDASVVDPGFWPMLRELSVTNLAGVPYTFDLLDHSAATTGSVPSLRLLTQAGGRLAPDKVLQWARRGQEEGWDLRVMYGQTEATARMAVSAPGRALTSPGSVGLPVGDGSFSVVDEAGREVPAGEVGALRFHGPSVMLGYAGEPADLARGRDVTTLDTGDLGRVSHDGSLEVVGRRSSFVKVMGVRIDVQRVEAALSARGWEAVVAAQGDRLGAVVCGGDTTAAEAVALASGLPEHVVDVLPVERIPRHSNGKPDRPAAVALLDEAAQRATNSTPRGSTATDLVALYADVLARTDATAESTFVGLGGDSLSYVELSVRLEDRLGTLPDDWPRRTIGELAAYRADDTTTPTVGQRWVARIDSTLVLRAAAVLTIVGTHVHLFRILGGAHILLGVAGYNFARFAASAPTATGLWQRVGRTIGRIAVPTALWVIAVGLVNGSYSAANALLLNWVFGPDHWTSTWRLWFIEALVWVLVALAGVLSVPAVRRWYHARPFAVAATVAAVTAFARLDVFDLTSPPGRGTAPAVLWLVAIGWAAAVATRRRDRLVLTAIVLASLPGFMDNPVREATIAAGLLTIIWVRTIAVPRLLVPAISVLASASLYVYLTHFEVYRLTGSSWVNLATSLALGILVWLVCSRGPRLLRRRLGTTAKATTRASTRHTPAPPAVHPPNPRSLTEVS